MWEIILVAIAGAAAISGMGLLSVRADRRSKKKMAADVIPAHRVYRVAPEPEPNATPKASGAMTMAASGGPLNGEENFAQVGNHSR